MTYTVEIADDLAARATAAGIAPGDVSRIVEESLVAAIEAAAPQHLSDTLADLLAEAETLEPAAATAGKPGYGDVITEKYRKQGFMLP